jgi:hypothetical protein
MTWVLSYYFSATFVVVTVLGLAAILCFRKDRS